MKNFTKQDLKTGMLVQYRNGEVRMVINKYLVGENGFCTISGFNNDLTDNNPIFNIMYVSNVLEDYELKPEHWTKETLMNNLLWSREEEKTFIVGGGEYNEQTLLSIIKEAKFIDVNKELPKQEKEPHKHKLWISTEMYGEFVGFFDEGKFMKNYSCEILDVVAWMHLPKHTNK